MRIKEIDSSTNPIKKYLTLQDRMPKYSFHEWANFIRVLIPDQLQWRIQWPKITKAQITIQDSNFVPLLGLSGGTTYCPLRVIQQFKMVQQIPPTWHPEEFTFEILQGPLLEKKNKELRIRVDGIVNSLKRSTKQIVQWHEDSEGEMKLFLASNEYIRWLKAK